MYRDNIVFVFALIGLIGHQCLGDVGGYKKKCYPEDELDQLCNKDEKFIICSHVSQPTCSNQQLYPINTTAVRGCYCKPGLVRNIKTWHCVKPSECPPTDNDPRCGDGEAYLKCSHQIPPTCTDMQVHNVKNRCVIGCFCKPGLVRNREQWNCVKPRDCPRSGYIYRAPKLRKILPEVFSAYLPNLKVVRIVYTGLEHIPNLNGLNTSSVLHMVDLDHNKIKKICTGEISYVSLSQLILSYNEIEIVEEEAFAESQIASMVFRGNTQLKIIHREAFRKLQNLRHIDLSDTSITTLPTAGLREIDILKIEDTYSLKKFPSVYNFRYIKEAWLTYPYHCCAFKYPKTHDPQEYEKHISGLKKLQDACKKNISIISWTPLDGSDSHSNYTEDEYIWGDETGVFHDGARKFSVKPLCNNGKIMDFREVQCSPEPDPFNPCEDLMGNWILRVPVWIIAHSALIGNLFVLIVIGTSHFRLTVSKFLMCNLAIADLCIGIHLLLLAGIDAHSIGAYFNFAIDWQEGYGCNVAGFLTIFGNVLSVYTLAVITLERWCTITWATHLNKRLKLRTSVKIMFLGWACAVLMAFLPLRGISSYARTSICLPLEYKNNYDAVYLATLLTFNCTAFTLICVCYGSMYRTIKAGSKTGIANSVRNDHTVAKKMALLVFTDFACLSPIAFFGITALLGYPLITVTQTKILLVFIYPLNSCANPCLYAILTQQYRKDFFILMGKLGMCKEHANSNRGAIRGKPLPYTAHFKRPRGVSRNTSKSSGVTNRNSLVSTVSNVNVEIPLNSSNRINENDFRKHDYINTDNL